MPRPASPTGVMFGLFTILESLFVIFPVIVFGDGAPRVPNLLFVIFSLSGVGGGGGG